MSVLKHTGADRCLIADTAQRPASPAKAGIGQFPNESDWISERRFGQHVAPDLRLCPDVKRRGRVEFGTLIAVVPEGTRCEISPSLTVPVSGISLEALERAVIAFALERHGGNQVQSARFLGLSRSALIYRMRKYRLTAGDRGRTFSAPGQASQPTGHGQ